MTTLKYFIYLFTITAFFNCTTNETIRTVRVGKYKVVGNIRKDMTYDGLIKFYDHATNRLVDSYTYKDNVLEGPSMTYNPDGSRLSVNYQDGRLNGDVRAFDSIGNLTKWDKRYYGLRVGPSVNYKNRQVSQYYFYSLENKELIHINYDSIQHYDLQQLANRGLFYWHISEYYEGTQDNRKNELFLYLPNPPGLNFQYSVCIVEPGYEIISTVNTFTSKESWETVELDFSSLKAGQNFALRLSMESEFDKDDREGEMFKIL